MKIADKDDDATDARTFSIERRSVIRGAVAGLSAGAFAVAAPARAESRASSDGLAIDAGAFHDAHTLKPLPYKAAALHGLSARLIESHWSHNYGGSVRALNVTNRLLAAALADRDSPAFTYNDLKREHLMRTGSVVLHELYFENMGGDGKAPADARRLIAASFGDFDRWETEYRRIAAGLGGGAGWVVFGYNRHFRVLENYWMADHMHSPASTVPLLVMDMYEHSYQMDYGAATARYIDAFFANINWDRVMARIEAIH
ncbi:MAG: superoxide dismutase [Gammaproteobacteria bacterium]|nr:superoxide dismutase [Gammaproteobacteria bacterium]